MVVSCAPNSSINTTITAGLNRRASRCPNPLSPMAIVRSAARKMPVIRLEAILLIGVPWADSARVTVKIVPHHSPVGPSMIARR
ncbi:hypothetical protein D3C72_2435590 [compost metagenome]